MFDVLQNFFLQKRDIFILLKNFEMKEVGKSPSCIAHSHGLYTLLGPLQVLSRRVRHDIRLEANISKYEANIDSLRSEQNRFYSLVSHQRESADLQNKNK